MLIYLRHGETQLNQPGDGERLRGWLPVPLTKKGEKQASEAASQISLRPDTFSASDLPRAVQTAEIVGKAIGENPKLDSNIRDWNTGDMAGQKVTDMLPELHRLIENPSIPAPGGEPFQAYLDRFVPAMKQRIESSGIHLVVGHARGASVVEGLASPVGGIGGDVDLNIVKEKPNLKPGGVLLVQPDYRLKVKNQ